MAKRHAQALFFLAGRDKNDPGADFSLQEEAAAKILARALEKADRWRLDDLVAAGSRKGDLPCRK